MRTSLVSRAVAAAVSAALIITAPGLPFYQAVAQPITVRTGARGNTGPSVPVVATTPGGTQTLPAGGGITGRSRQYTQLQLQGLTGGSPVVSITDSGAQQLDAQASFTGPLGYGTPASVSVPQSQSFYIDGTQAGPFTASNGGSPSERKQNAVRRSIAKVAGWLRTPIKPSALWVKDDAAPTENSAPDPKDVINSQPAPPKSRLSPLPALKRIAAPAQSVAHRAYAALAPPVSKAAKTVAAPFQRAFGKVDGFVENHWSPTKSAIFLVLGLLVAQVGVEAWGLPWNDWVDANYPKGSYATLTSIGLFVGLATSYIGGVITDKIGARWASFLGMTLAALGSAAIITFTPHFGIVIAMQVVINLANNTAVNAQQNMPAMMYNGDRNRIKKFFSNEQFILEIAGIGIPFSLELILAKLGQMGTMYLYPGTALVAAAMIFMLVRLGNTQAAPGAAPAADAPKKKERVLDPRLLSIGRMGYPAFLVVNILLYRIIARSWGQYADLPNALGLAGKLVAYYSFGGLLASAYLGEWHLWIWAKLKEIKQKGLVPAVKEWYAAIKLAILRMLGKAPPAPPAADGGEAPEPTPAERAAALKKVFWSVLASSFGMFGFLPFIGKDLFWAEMGMAFFGVTSVIGQLELLALAQENMPPAKRGKMMGAMKSAAFVVAIGGLFGMTYMMEHYKGLPTPFYAMLAAFAVVVAYQWVVAYRIWSYIRDLLAGKIK